MNRNFSPAVTNHAFSRFTAVEEWLSTALKNWVEEVSRLTKPERIVWCDGSRQEYERLAAEMLRDGTFYALNESTYPNCYLHRSDPNDVARTENVTFICTRQKEDAGPTNNWMAPAEAKEKVGTLFDGAMKGRTMYVVPYMMGPADSPHSRIGVEITDSPYVVASMRIMARMGQVALDRLGSSDDFVPGLHSLGDLNPDRRFIVHFPEEKLIWSIGSGYGGNALLGKKCFALRIASWMAREQGWMAEHMLILGLEDPSGQSHLHGGGVSERLRQDESGHDGFGARKSGLSRVDGRRRHRLDADRGGRLPARDQSGGRFFRRRAGHQREDQSECDGGAAEEYDFHQRGDDAVARALVGRHDGDAAAGLIDWQGRAWSLATAPAAQPNSRYTVPASQAPCISPHWEDPAGVPISAFIFGGRRAPLAPLVYESLDWQHGVFVGATMASETTAAATGAVGVTRRDPMAMLPFCGYNMGDYFRHWLDMGRSIPHPPKIFHVNWFRKGADGKFLWPGFGENVRVLKWMLERVEGKDGHGESHRMAAGTDSRSTGSLSRRRRWKSCCVWIPPIGPGRPTSASSSRNSAIACPRTVGSNTPH